MVSGTTFTAASHDVAIDFLIGNMPSLEFDRSSGQLCIPEFFFETVQLFPEAQKLPRIQIGGSFDDFVDPAYHQPPPSAW
jgi:hypothetical protein